jgi:microcystin-dependent protein
MAQPYIGEIRIFAGNFAPVNYAFCRGQLMPISQNTALFSILGTFYGGDGVSTFGLPDLQGRLPIGTGQGPGLSDYVIGERAGTESVTIITTTMPQHVHGIAGATSTDGMTSGPTSTSILATSAAHDKIYSTNAPTTTVINGPTSLAGGSQPHDNIQPYLAVNFIIALFGVFPSRN